jgi:hypothetical protein
MEIKETDDEGRYEPASEDDSALVSLMFVRITELYPDWPMADRSDLAMSLFVTVKKWAHNLELTSTNHRIVNN